ncbi:MAG TPA: 3-oxoacid CoA-transferase subunit B [Kofleriaceae bacterium]|nr:3-oxoacid CoA-transferase subunit B [Kofleriaceae bacterium]
MAWSREEIARRAAKDIVPGSIVNLGIGLPTRVADSAPPEIWLHSENGILGMGPFPEAGQEDPQIINAGKQTVTIARGGSCFDSALSFSMIRGGHVDLAILGAMQVSATGDLANWSIPGGRTMGIGGAMDLATGARRVIVLTTHVTKTGEPKLVAECTYPLTSRGAVSRVITDLAVIDITGDGFVLRELAPEVSESEVREKTGAPLRVS